MLIVCIVILAFHQSFSNLLRLRTNKKLETLHKKILTNVPTALNQPASLVPRPQPKECGTQSTVLFHQRYTDNGVVSVLEVQ